MRLVSMEFVVLAVLAHAEKSLAAA